MDNTNSPYVAGTTDDSFFVNCPECGEPVHSLYPEFNTFDEAAMFARRFCPRCNERADVLGFCHCCGQVTTIDADRELSQDELNERATLLCKCDGGKATRQAKAACERLEHLLGGKEAYEHCNVLEFLKEAIYTVQDEFILNLAVRLDAQTTLKISKNAKGALLITKTKTNTKQEAVQEE